MPQQNNRKPFVKPPRRSIELYLPEAVVLELKQNAKLAGVSATVLVMDLLKAAGYKIRDSDYVDKRTLPRIHG